MTALDEVLATERSVKEEIEAAKKEAATIISTAQSGHTDSIEAEKKSLEAAEAFALVEQEKQVAGTVAKIESDTESEIKAIEQRFSTKKSDLITDIKKRF